MGFLQDCHDHKRVPGVGLDKHWICVDISLSIHSMIHVHIYIHCLYIITVHTYNKPALSDKDEKKFDTEKVMETTSNRSLVMQAA